MRFPITAYDKGVEFVKDGDAVIVKSLGGSPDMRMTDAAEHGRFVEAALGRFADDDTHEVVLPFSGEKAILKFTRAGALTVDFEVGGEVGEVALSQVVSQTRHNADTHPYGDAPYQEVLDRKHLRDDQNLDLSSKADLDALLLRIGAWIDWYRAKPEPNPSP